MMMKRKHSCWKYETPAVVVEDTAADRTGGEILHSNEEEVMKNPHFPYDSGLQQDSWRHRSHFPLRDTTERLRKKCSNRSCIAVAAVAAGNAVEAVAVVAGIHSCTVVDSTLARYLPHLHTRC